ncbi:Asp23/Gls24 family envelope stress response protein [Streptomyces sp. SAS_269]|uniref:Asp23/Gls24 family envelope stress response protein n=1 Tax=Streptomyces sp. SAS_269 TaxID=3412749 RepID=UPI00403C6D75
MTAVSTETGTTRPLPAPVPSGERGALRIADRVVAKIASRAAREALGPLPADAAAPHAVVVVHPQPRAGSGRGSLVGTARVRLQVELAHPVDIGARCAAVRRQVTERVSELVSMEVLEVAVRVERLHLAPLPGAHRGRTR